MALWGSESPIDGNLQVEAGAHIKDPDGVLALSQTLEVF